MVETHGLKEASPKPLPEAAASLQAGDESGYFITTTQFIGFL
jgi:hypothetical protein